MSRRSLHDGERSAHIAPTPVERHSFEDGVYPFQHLHLPWMGTERERGECTWWSSTTEGGQGEGEGGVLNTHRGGRCRAAERTVPPSCLVSGHRWAATPPEASPPPPEQDGRFYFSLFARFNQWSVSLDHLFPNRQNPFWGKINNQSAFFFFWPWHHSHLVAVWSPDNFPRRWETRSVWREARRPPVASPLQPQRTQLDSWRNAQTNKTQTDRAGLRWPFA